MKHSDVETEGWAHILNIDLGASLSPGLLVGGVLLLLLLLLLLWLLGRGRRLGAGAPEVVGSLGDDGGNRGVVLDPDRVLQLKAGGWGHNTRSRHRFLLLHLLGSDWWLLLLLLLLRLL